MKKSLNKSNKPSNHKKHNNTSKSSSSLENPSTTSLVFDDSVFTNTKYEYDIAGDIFFSSWPNWIRWVLMVPVTIIAVILVPTLYKVIMSFIGGSDGMGSNTWRVILEIIQSVLTGQLFVIVPAYVAPKKQLLVAIVFLTLAALFSGMLLIGGLLLRESTGDKLYIVFHTFLTLLGAGIAALVVKNESQ